MSTSELDLVWPEEEGRPARLPRQLSIEQQVQFYFEELRDPLYRYLGLTGASAAGAEDVVQDVFIRLYKHLLAGGKLPEVRAWAFRVAYHLYIDEKRKRSRESSHRAVREVDSADSALNPEERFEQNERFRKMNERVGNLTEVQRQSLHLRAEGLPYREIATVLNLNISTVFGAVQSAVKKLGSELD
jgi:RNA polymerase sigma-70 factor (ECF subfamily)